MQRKKNKGAVLNSEELDYIKSLVGQLEWITGQTRPDIPFEPCSLCSQTRNGTINDLLQAHNVLEWANRDNIVKGDIEKFKIIGLND